MRYIEVGSDKFEFSEGTFTLVRDDVREDLPESSVEVAPTAATAFFRESRTFISLSVREWEYLRGIVDSVELPVEEAPVAEEVAAPAPTSRRGRRKV